MTTERDTTPYDGDGVEAGTAGDAGSTAPDAEMEVELIVADIEQTRSEMTGTINALGERLDPQRIMGDARENVRAATVGRVEEMVSDVTTTAQETGTGIVQTIRQNPIPAAMAGIGVFMLWQRFQAQQGEQSRYGNGGRRRAYRTSGYGAGYGYGGYEPYGAYAGPGADEGGSGSGIQERASGMADQARSAASDAASSVQGAASDVADRAGQTASDIADRASYEADRLARQARQAPDQITRMMEENPLGFGLAAVAVGAAVGLAIPTSRREQEMLGQAREQVAHRAAETIEEASSKLEESSQQTGGTTEG